ncbi:uncharacterized protein LOC120664105 [Panicum virgatum]|uniref:Uncharacterized protein n=1 Tax=Panicum virgatum TaxID=38727 RepID=A0A8T0VZ04_PANVG|nr:uncharacterized protein LOC120664091 [Panicum virgatum]XP_039799049.1 uncharacterized protein LOC120664105 [Panicum virgatum]KAG2640368.1 hypothetical protein PVAP13_2KG088500 [Panicum virgatum]KAG2640370.1 hypothetical protein PVAP13_2KG088732 [Panicum virgatum]
MKSLPCIQHWSGTGGEDYATKATRKTGASLMDKPMNSETGTHEKLGTEHPSTNARIFTAMASIPSSKAHEQEVEIEVVKETSTSQGLAHDLSMPMEALALDQTDPRQSQAALVTPVPDQVTTNIPTKSTSSVPPATTLVATSDISHIQTQLQYDKNLRTELYNICNQHSESLFQRIEAYISQSQVYKDVSRLKEELRYAISDKIEDFGKVRILEERLKEQTDKLQSESKRSQEIMASQRELLREHEALKSEMAKKDEDLTNLKHGSTMVDVPAMGSSQ